MDGCVMCDRARLRELAEVYFENKWLLSWAAYPQQDAHIPLMHAHLHVVPRFDDEPYRDRGGRTAIKDPANRRPDPSAPGTGRARLFGSP